MGNLALSADTVGFVVAAILTLFVFSYLLGDNALYRVAEYLFVGVAIGYVTVVAFHQVLAAKLIRPLAEAVQAGDTRRVGLLLIPLLLGLLLLLKSLRRAGPLSWLGSLPVAYLLGVGGAVAIAGALLGTLLPQVSAASDAGYYVTRYGPGLALFSGLAGVIGTAGVLLHFYFGKRAAGCVGGLRDDVVQIWGGLGWWFIVIAFGAILATTFLARVSMLGGRIQFLIDGVRRLVEG